MLYHLFRYYNKNNEPEHRNGLERILYLENHNTGIFYRKHRLPKWAYNDPKIFFAAAVKNSPPKVHTYRELEISILNVAGKNVPEYLELIIHHFMPDKYYSILVEQPQGDGHTYDCHIMFNDGIIDKWEQEQERPEDQFFWLHRSRNPERGGARKDFYSILYTEGAELHKYRKIFVEATNDYWQEKGIDKEAFLLCGLFTENFENLLLVNEESKQEELSYYQELSPYWE